MSAKKGPATCKLVKWGEGCENCINSGKARCTYAQHSDAFLDSIERVGSLSSAHPKSALFLSSCYFYFLSFSLDLRVLINRVHHHFYDARLSYQLAQRQHRAGLEAFEDVIQAARFIEDHFPPMHAIGPTFATEEALRYFAGCSIHDIEESIRLLHECDLAPDLTHYSFHPPPSDEDEDDEDDETTGSRTRAPSPSASASK